MSSASEKPTPLFLTTGSHGQVADLTGAHTKKRQIAVLRQNGIRHTLNAAGWPVVPRSAVDGVPTKADTEGAWRSNKVDRAA